MIIEDVCLWGSLFSHFMSLISDNLINVTNKYAVSSSIQSLLKPEIGPWDENISQENRRNAYEQMYFYLSNYKIEKFP